MQFELFKSCITSSIEGILALPTTAIERGDLCRWRWRIALCSRNPDSVKPLIFDSYSREVSFAVTVEVDIPLDFVDKLRLEDVRGDEASCSVVLCDDTGSIDMNFGDRESNVKQSLLGKLKKVAKVSTRAVTAAFNQVTCDKGASKLVEIRLCPTMPPPSSPDNRASIRHSPALFWSAMVYQITS